MSAGGLSLDPSVTGIEITFVECVKSDTIPLRSSLILEPNGGAVCERPVE